MRKPKPLYAFNESKQSFINLGVTIANTHLSRLRGLLGKMRLRSDEGLWIVPSCGVHTFGLMFSIDVIYLDAQLRVVHVKENLGTLRIAPICLESRSVLELPARSICESGTQVGDQLLICAPEEMEAYWAARGSKSPSSQLTAT